MPIYEAFYAELRRRGCTQYEAAQQIGVSKQVMSNWISGRHAPSREHVEAVANFLHVNPSDVEAMAQRAQRVDRIAELERVQVEILATLDELRAALEAAGLLPDGANVGRLPRARREATP